MKSNIFIATHKQYEMPADHFYIPVQAGASLSQKLPYVGDNTGDNISDKNREFCELTVHYWIWKNVTEEIYGLCHYRRYFKGKNGPATKAEVETWLNGKDAVFPRKRNYYIETNYSQYIHAHHEKDLIITREILVEKYPDYIQAWEDVMGRTSGHRFNMFIMKAPLFVAYSEWLFSVLFELENRLDISRYNSYDRRVFGFVAERLLDVWVVKNNVLYSEKGIYETESTNWLKKGSAFIWRKFFSRKK